MNTIKKHNISFFCLSLEFGGAQRVISNLVKALVKDYNISLILFYNIIDFELPKEVNVIILSKSKADHKTNIFSKFYDYIGCTRRFFKVIKSNNIEVSISFLPAPNFVNGMARIFNNNLKTIASERRYIYNDTMKSTSLLLSKILYPLLYNRNTTLFSNSIYINEDLKHRFKVKIPMHVIYNPVVIPDAYLNKQCDWDDIETFKIINVGRIVENKNQQLIIDALKQLKQHSIQLTILGDGNLRDSLKTYAQKNDLSEQVVLPGAKTDVFGYLLKSHCFILSSYTEGFPNVVLEAMAVGLPIISTNCLTGPLELLNGNEPADIKNADFFKAKYGLLVNTDDPIGMSKAIRYFRDNPDERKRYGVLGLERVKEYSLNTISNQVSSLIKSL